MMAAPLPFHRHMNTQFDENLAKIEASKRIDEPRVKGARSVLSTEQSATCC
jgi:hypothetical protein